MRAKRIAANLRVAGIEAAKGFYTDFLGLGTEEFNLGRVARFTAPDTGVNIQLVTGDATAPEDSVISVHTDDVDGAFDEARKTRLRDCAATNYGTMGCSQVLRPCSGRQRTEHRVPSGLANRH